MSYALLPVYLGELKDLAPAAYSQLGAPRIRNIFSLQPGNWTYQRRFFWFFFSGRALRVSRGEFRLLSLLMSLSCFGMVMSVPFAFYDLAIYGNF